MKNLRKGFATPVFLVLITLLVIGGGVYMYHRSKQTSNSVGTTSLSTLTTTKVSSTVTNSAVATQTFLTVLSPNGGETIKWGNIVMAGDLYFQWTTSQKERYFPSSKMSAYITDASGNFVRNDPVTLSIRNLGGGVFTTSFAGEKKLEINTKYKVKVCDYLSDDKNSLEYCDSSDDFFIIK